MHENNSGLRSDETAILVIRGVLALLFGIAAVFWPGLTLVTLVYLFSAFILLNGVLTLVTAAVAIIKKAPSSMLTKVLLILLGIAEIAVAVYLLRNPLVSLVTFILIIGFSLIARGIVEAVVALHSRESGAYKTIVTITGIISVIAGIVILMYPASGGVAFVWVLGLFALVSGPLLIALSLAMNGDSDDDDKVRRIDDKQSKRRP